MSNKVIEGLEFAGFFSVDSGQAMVGDPCYLSEYDLNTGESWDLDGKEGQYSYQGISATTCTSNYGEVGNSKAVAFSTGYGDGFYPVYVKLNDDNRVSMVIIDFEENIKDVDTD